MYIHNYFPTSTPMNLEESQCVDGGMMRTKNKWENMRLTDFEFLPAMTKKVP